MGGSQRTRPRAPWGEWRSWSLDVQGQAGGVVYGSGLSLFTELPRRLILGNRASDAAASPGDQSCLALKFAHASLLIHIAPIICNDRQRHYLPIFPALSPAIY